MNVATRGRSRLPMHAALALVVIAAILFISVRDGRLAKAPLAAQEVEDELLAELVREARVDDLLLELSGSLRPRALAIENITVVDLAGDAASPRRSVLIEDGRIARVSDPASFDAPAGALRIDGSDRYLMPGLVDAHVHAGRSNLEKLLALATGVTTVREMAGSAWMLSLRELIAANRVLAPNLYVAGPMLNYFDLGIYAQVVRSPHAARRRARAHAASGFDFIKVWNVMPLELLSGVGEIADSLGLQLIGHVPHNVTLADAYASGLRVQEHLKGFLLDNRLEITSEDYLAFARGKPDLWLTPTLTVACRAATATGAERERLEGSSWMRFVSGATRARWRREAGANAGDASARVCEIQREIFRALVADGFRNFVAGTDFNGSNPYMLAGFALHEELRAMRDLGLSERDVLAAATKNAARAMGREHEFGLIAEGLRADLLILDADPRRNLDALLGPRDVVVRGSLLPRTLIERILDDVSRIHSESVEQGGAVERLIERYGDEAYRPLIHPFSFQTFAGYLGEHGRNSDAVRIANLGVQRFPRYDMYEARGDAYLVSGDTARAVQDYRTSAEMYPWNDSILRKLSQLGYR